MYLSAILGYIYGKLKFSTATHAAAAADGVAHGRSAWTVHRLNTIVTSLASVTAWIIQYFFQCVSSGRRSARYTPRVCNLRVYESLFLHAYAAAARTLVERVLSRDLRRWKNQRDSFFFVFVVKNIEKCYVSRDISPEYLALYKCRKQFLTVENARIYCEARCVYARAERLRTRVPKASAFHHGV